MIVSHNAEGEEELIKKLAPQRCWLANTALNFTRSRKRLLETERPQSRWRV